PAQAYVGPETSRAEATPQEVPDAVPAGAASDQPSAVPADLDFYTLFLHRLRAETESAALPASELQERLQLTKAQLADWLKRAVEEGDAEKLARPVRYQAATQRQSSLGL